MSRSQCFIVNVLPKIVEDMGMLEALSWIQGQKYGSVVVETSW